ncbi:hypothetical protein [Flavihumibacter fluvii]|uniref:hypothetical protein n=1 Tax=Flavihumibacter fluvii TaxID=2838157 RepID=UPI001BDE5690|nr:hypothetical protein [Flavihumibacter fluvii]ULQ53308.1 hypothetical protein KJS93_03130 [Flavihumibacter fluvii]
MEINIIIFLNLLLYSIIVSQSFSYIISLEDVQRKMDAATYITFRKQTDKNFLKKFSKVVYGTIATNTLLVVMTSNYTTGLLFITAALAWVALVVEILLTLKGNMPINRLVNTWTTENYPDNWEMHREKWLQVFRKRQVLNITGFLLLLIGAIFQ